MNHLKIKFIVILLLLANRLFAQVPKTDTIKEMHGLQFGILMSRKYLQFTESQDGRVNFQSILTRQIKKIQNNGKEQLLIIQSYQSGTIDKDSSYCDLSTLLPVAYHSDVQSEGYKEKVIFAKTGIETTITTKDGTKMFTLENKQLFNGVMMDEIISSLKLREGVTYVFKALNPGMNHFEYLENIFVEGKEVIELAGIGKISCWKIKTQMEGSPGSDEWYTVKDQIQVKKRFELAGGSVFYRVLLTGI
ncbi:MAG: hypothetical protein ABI761_12385 [Saprospiraceae bacterium]